MDGTVQTNLSGALVTPELPRLPLGSPSRPEGWSAPRRSTATEWPQVSPAPYSGLRQPPKALYWKNAPEAAAYQVEICSGTYRTRFRTARAGLLWPVNFPLRPDSSVTWAISVPGAAEASVAGAFWRLPDADLARYEAVRPSIAQITDPLHRTVVDALAQAEVSLYHDALAQLEKLLAVIKSRHNGQNAAGEALVLRALVSVLRTMREGMRQYSRPAQLAWADARIDHHATRLALLSRYAAMEA